MIKEDRVKKRYLQVSSVTHLRVGYLKVLNACTDPNGHLKTKRKLSRFNRKYCLPEPATALVESVVGGG